MVFQQGERWDNRYIFFLFLSIAKVLYNYCDLLFIMLGEVIFVFKNWCVGLFWVGKHWKMLCAPGVEVKIPRKRNLVANERVGETLRSQVSSSLDYLFWCSARSSPAHHSAMKGLPSRHLREVQWISVWEQAWKNGGYLPKGSSNSFGVRVPFHND